MSSCIRRCILIPWMTPSSLIVLLAAFLSCVLACMRASVNEVIHEKSPENAALAPSLSLMRTLGRARISWHFCLPNDSGGREKDHMCSLLLLLLLACHRCVLPPLAAFRDRLYYRPTEWPWHADPRPNLSHLKKCWKSEDAKISCCLYFHFFGCNLEH